MEDYAGDNTAEERDKLARKLAAKFRTDLKGKTPDAGTELQEEITESLEQGMPEQTMEEDTMEPMQEPEAPQQGLMAKG
jgi:hypothetical protein